MLITILMQDAQGNHGLTVEIISIVVAFAGAILAVYSTIRTTQANKELTSLQHALNVRNKFLERQTDLYFEASGLASRIATNTSEQDVQEAIVRFNEIYWGELAVVEDSIVEPAMVDFKRLLEREDCSKRDLKLSALKLSRALRDSLNKSWKAELSEIQHLRTEDTQDTSHESNDKIEEDEMISQDSDSSDQDSETQTKEGEES
ncbi:hypothetical protein MWU50_09645 [Flavobacteriaceae bacterium S0862]|nr:hypothetical protein [Flavobacteriaceae bacterium S0862]